MKKQVLIFVFLLVILLSHTSCTKYYYSFIQSDHPDIHKNELGDFVQENDSVCVIYSFYGRDLPVNITVVNKMDKPLYVDWNQSALVVDDITDFIGGNPTGRKKAHSTISYPYRGEGRRYAPDRYAAAAQRLYAEDGVSFVPANARINHTPLVLTNFSFHKIPGELFTKTPFTATDEHEKKVDVLNFTEKSSPVQFRSYLTLFTLEPDGTRYNVMDMDQGFYISTLIRGGKKKPELFPQFVQERGDFFYVCDERGKNAGTIVGLITVGMVGIAVEIAAGPYDY